MQILVSISDANAELTTGLLCGVGHPNSDLHDILVCLWRVSDSSKGGGHQALLSLKIASSMQMPGN